MKPECSRLEQPSTPLYNLTFNPQMSAQPKPQQQSRADNYRELARQAGDMVPFYTAQAERFEKQGDAQIAAEYRQLASESEARAERYTVLAGSSD
jgi:hypothetical protein